MTPPSVIRRCVTAQTKATTITPNNPSELPRVLIVATIGFKSQILANLRARPVVILPPSGDRRTRTMSQPAMISETAKTAFPKENHAVPGQAVGRRSHAKRGV